MTCKHRFLLISILTRMSFIYSSIGLCYPYFPSTNYNNLLSDSVLEKIKAAYFK